MKMRPFVFGVVLAVLGLAPRAFADRPVPLCACDCDRDFAVGIDEMISAVRMALESAPLEQCPAADANADGSVDIADLIRGVSRTLHGCAVALGEECPDACTGGCVAGVCVIECDAISECQNDRIACPSGMACRVQCDGISSCQGSQFFCAEHDDCELRCTNTSSCQGGYLVCGDHGCDAACSGEAASVDAVICGAASTCDSGCEEVHPCTPGIDCPDDPCFGMVCGHGACAIDGGAHCVCDGGYEFNEALRRCAPQVQPCAGIDCSAHGQCVAADGQATCTCEAGYVPMGLQCLPSTTCPEPPAPPEVCPTACTGGCIDGVCVIACQDTSACQSDVLVCPDDMPCRIQCAGVSACQHAQFVCPADAPCDVQCSNTSACQSGYVTCGNGACSVACSGEATSVSSVQCGESCACATTCAQLHPCVPGTDCPGDLCFDTFCGRGHCVVDSATTTHCECDDGFLYDLERKRCLPQPQPCHSVDCGGHGTCSVVGVRAVCTCDPGFVAMGLTCEAADQCPAAPPPPATCPEACTGGCIDGVCVIDCGGLSACRGTLQCPDGIACRVECAGVSSCQSVQIVCPADAACDVQCSNTSACQGSQVTCGAGACTASCGGVSASTTLHCGDSCACRGCGSG